MRSMFLASLVTAAQRQFAYPSAVRISPLISFPTAPGCALLLFSSLTLDVSIVQYSLSAINDVVAAAGWLAASDKSVDLVRTEA